MKILVTPELLQKYEEARKAGVFAGTLGDFLDELVAALEVWLNG